MQILEFQLTKSQILKVGLAICVLTSTPDDSEVCSSLRATGHRNFSHGNRRDLKPTKRS